MTTTTSGTARLVFTDLDGSLLDHHSYDWRPAAPWLARLKAAGVPVIPVTSKTRAELMALRRELGLEQCPFVAENGAVIGLPESWLLARENTNAEGVRVLTLGADAATLARTLQDLQYRGEWPVRRLRDLPVETVMALTGLDRASAIASGQREGSEPLIWDGDDAGIASFRAALSARGLSLTRGGRFWHLMGDIDKGRAALWLRDRFAERHHERPLTLGLGDGPNDAPLLNVVDRAVLIRATHGHPVGDVRSTCYRTVATGPRGWAEGLDHWLGEELP